MCRGRPYSEERCLQLVSVSQVQACFFGRQNGSFNQLPNVLACINGCQNETLGRPSFLHLSHFHSGYFKIDFYIFIDYV